MVDANPNSAIAYDWVDLAYLMKGDEQGALAARLKQMEVGGAGPDEIAGMKAAFATGGFKGCVRRELDRLLERGERGYINNGGIAVYYAMLGENEQALARLHKAVEDRELNVVALKVEPRWDSYRSDPRFQNLLQRIGLPQ